MVKLKSQGGDDTVTFMQSKIHIQIVRRSKYTMKHKVVKVYQSMGQTGEKKGGMGYHMVNFCWLS